LLGVECGGQSFCSRVSSLYCGRWGFVSVDSRFVLRANLLRWANVYGRLFMGWAFSMTVIQKKNSTVGYFYLGRIISTVGVFFFVGILLYILGFLYIP
jgi:hypothetical protein